MTALEICMILIGIATIVISYLISDKVSEERLKKKADEYILSDKTKQSLQLQAKEAIVEALDEMSESISEKAEITLERLSNEKIMAVHEYSDSVLNEITKNHNEVMFLFNILNEKEQEIKETALEVQNTVKTVKQQVKYQEPIKETMKGSTTQQKNTQTSKTGNDSAKNETIPTESSKIENNANKIEQKKQDTRKTAPKNTKAKHNKYTNKEKELTEDLSVNTSDQKERQEVILRMCQEGKTAKEIAKELKMGTGEVRLIINLSRR